MNFFRERWTVWFPRNSHFLISGPGEERGHQAGNACTKLAIDGASEQMGEAGDNRPI